MLVSSPTFSDDGVSTRIFHDEKRRCYVERRPDEEEALYNKRLKRFVYTNILGDAIRDFVVKLTSSPMYSKGLGDDDFWLRFRKSVNGKNKKEKDFINNLFKMLLTYGHCYVFVDKPTPKGIIRNRLEERLQKIDPYCVLYKPEDIIDYGIDDNDILVCHSFQNLTKDCPTF